MEANQSIPFTIQLRRLFRTDFVLEHEVCFGVARAERTASLIIKSNRYDDPLVVERFHKGGIELPDALIDQLGLLCFELMASQLRDAAGDDGWWVFDDIGTHVRDHFDATTAERTALALSAHVQAGVVVMNLCMIDGEDPF